MKNTDSNFLTQSIHFTFLRSIEALIATVWTSALLFGLYILTFYVAAYAQGNLEQWNIHLPGLYVEGKSIGTAGIGLHFAGGGLILILGSIQLISRVRKTFPLLHRWIGRFYVSACVLTAIGGLIFIMTTQTIGGLIMNIGFALYGFLMLLAAINTYRFSRAKNFQEHRAWAIRLYSLAIGSWLYRMYYGFWLLLADGLGHNGMFQGPFDYIMDFFFFVPNLIVAEFFIRKQNLELTTGIQFITSVIFLAATLFLVIGTYYFTLYYWGPSIMSVIA